MKSPDEFRDYRDKRDVLWGDAVARPGWRYPDLTRHAGYVADVLASAGFFMPGLPSVSIGVSSA